MSRLLNMTARTTRQQQKNATTEGANGRLEGPPQTATNTQSHEDPPTKDLQLLKRQLTTGVWKDNLVLSGGGHDVLQMAGLPPVLPVEEAINRLLHRGAHVLRGPIRHRDHDGACPAHLEPGKQATVLSGVCRPANSIFTDERVHWARETKATAAGLSPRHPTCATRV